jgi:hypothetical protein
LRNVAAHAHAVAAVAHEKGDHLSAQELSKHAEELSQKAHRHVEEDMTVPSGFNRP